jgi:O-antigen/teichoic acid export membrane protein
VIAAWVGPGFSSAVPVAMLLACAVAARVGTATAMTVLKGAGRHRLLATLNLATALANLTLSLVLVRRFGIVGVAVGTVVPVAATAMFVAFPAGCRRVGLPVAQGLVEAVWPAAWPAAVMVSWLFAVRPWVPAWLPAIGLHAVVAGGLYLLLFARWGLPATERRLYLSKAAVLIGRLRRVGVTT